ncbi:hypothetical protein [Magnetospirillum sp. ME-1]|uniref:hypothetical protein n=1 Tax=Magnetospirillum sp. ME-1 TaxID=1639348 RepID=UPI0011AEB953|nr:hypothetical protein [Magnetospirillum sp. ME-1]
MITRDTQQVILEALADAGGALTFDELISAVPVVGGDGAMTYGASLVTIWPGTSDEGVEALGELHAAGRISFTPVPPPTYLLAYGRVVPRLPVVKDTRPFEDYRRLTWLPCVIELRSGECA